MSCLRRPLSFFITGFVGARVSKWQQASGICHAESIKCALLVLECCGGARATTTVAASAGAMAQAAVATRPRKPLKHFKDKNEESAQKRTLPANPDK